jgi:hypothetical protein
MTARENADGPYHWDKQMVHHISQRNSNRRHSYCGIGVAQRMFGSIPEAAYSDEGGYSFWFLG